MTPKVIFLFLLAITSGTAMFTSQKYLTHLSPYLINGVALLIAGIGSFILWYIYDAQTAPATFHWAMLIYWVSILLLNVAYSMIYMQNIPVAYAPIIVTGVMTVALWFVWYFFFHEAISRKFMLWGLMILAGMVVIVK